MIAVDGVRVSARDDLVYYLLNKPAGYVSTASDPEGRATVVELVPDDAARLPRRSPRLRDRGAARAHQRRRPHAAAHAPEPWRGQDLSRRGRRRADPGELRSLRTGVDLDDGPTAPATVTLVQERAPGAAIELTIHEGRNRQVRRMCEAIGHPVRRLVRTRIGPLADWRLPPGEWRPLTPQEVRALYEAATGAESGDEPRRTRRARRRPPANLARREIAGAARRDHVRRGLQDRDRHQGVAPGARSCSPATTSPTTMSSA